MRTTPTASLGLLFGVPPLHLDIKGRAVNSAYRMRAYGQWKPGTRHSKIPLLEEPLLGIKTDFIPQCFYFGRNWTVTIHSREEWLQHKDSLPEHGDVWLSDGPRSENRSGAGYYSRRGGKVTFLFLERYATVFQTEVIAILGCAQRLENLNTEGRHISICPAMGTETLRYQRQ